MLTPQPNTCFMKNFFPFLFFVLFWQTLSAQTCAYLAYDGFDYDANAPLNGLSGSTGWQSFWDVQNATATVPGYQINNGAGSLQYNDLQQTGRYAIGGYQYLTSGRMLNTSDSGPFGVYVAEYETGIGTQTGGTLWTSVLLRKDGNNGQTVWVDYHNNNIAWCSNCASQHIAVGYFGANSDVAGQRRWTLRLNGNFYPTSIPVVTGATVFIALRLTFNDGITQVDMFVNPATLGSNTPAVPTMSQTTGSANIIRNVAVYLGDGVANGAIDELRFATSYQCVAPDAATLVNLPPVAVISAAPVSGQVPLTVNLNGTTSYDPEGQPLTYSWNFGDGTPSASGSSVSHVYNATGQLNVTLTVTDNLGLQHTTYQTLTLLNEYNTFSCQTTVTALQMASCGQSNGRLRINAGSNTFSLLNNSNNPMPVVSGNEYHNLPVGAYQLLVNGTNGCSDSMQLHIRTDSTTCNGWQASICNMDIGTNMSGFSDWGVERPMKNLFKHIRREVLTFSSSCTNWNCGVIDEMSFDTDGYPTHIPQTTSVGATMVRYVISADGGNLQQGQQYVLLYDGVGTIQMQGGINVTANTPGRIAFTALNNGNQWIHITASTLGNHLRNIRLLRLADEFADLDANPFYQGFLDKIEPFKQLRFMDWGNTNGNTNEEWTDRLPLTHFSYSGSEGVPYETMIALANLTRKDVWICVPHLADDDYLAQMATLFRDNLNPNLNIYLEYSNEVWNWIFDQAHYNDQNRPSNLTYGRASAERSKNAFRIWHEVFGSQKDRVKRVLGLQGGYNSLNEQILSQLNADDWDYGSPTHYFGLDHSNTANPVLNAGSTVADVMLNAQNSWNGFKNLVKQDYNNVHIFGKEVITYEGGQHFVGNVFGIPYPYQQAMWDAQYSPLMYQMYDQMLDTIRNWGCKMAINFSLAGPQESVYGSWGVVSDIETPPPYMTTAPKYQALLDNIPVTPDPFITGQNEVCSSNTYIYTVPEVVGNTYQWTVIGGVILSGQGTPSIEVQWLPGVSGTVLVSQTGE